MKSTWLGARMRAWMRGWQSYELSPSRIMQRRRRCFDSRPRSLYIMVESTHNLHCMAADLDRPIRFLASDLPPVPVTRGGDRGASHNHHIAAILPDLVCLLAVPPPGQEVLARRECGRHAHEVNDIRRHHWVVVRAAVTGRVSQPPLTCDGGGGCCCCRGGR